MKETQQTELLITICYIMKSNHILALLQVSAPIVQNGAKANCSLDSLTLARVAFSWNVLKL